MNSPLKLLAKVAAVIASLFCLFGGVWILSKSGFSKDDALGTGIGLYFVGKSFFVGPMLWLAAERLDK